jgi:hypothetical protein
MKINIGLSIGDRVKYRNRKNRTGIVLDIQGQAVRVEWDYATFPLSKIMWVNRRSLRRTGIIRLMIKEYQKKAGQIVTKLKTLSP